jgi:hypothetical protein
MLVSDYGAFDFGEGLFLASSSFLFPSFFFFSACCERMAMRVYEPMNLCTYMGSGPARSVVAAGSQRLG